MSVVKKRLRFTDVDDLLLLREVLSNNPFENPDVWSIIQQHISIITGKLFSLRTLKEHLELLIKLWIEQVKILKDKSGIEIEYTEKNNLCESIYSLMNEFKKEKRNNKINIEDKKRGIDARNKWSLNTYCYSSHQASTSNVVVQESSNDMHSITDDYFSITHPLEGKENLVSFINTDKTPENEAPNSPNIPESVLEDADVNNESTTLNNDTPAVVTPRKRKILSPVRSKKRKVSTQRQGLAYLASYDETQRTIKQKELEIEERKVAIEEKKLILQEKHTEMTRLENQRRFDLEEKKLDILDQTLNKVTIIIERQEKIIDILLKKEYSN